MFIIWHKSNKIRSEFVVMRNKNCKVEYKFQWKINSQIESLSIKLAALCCVNWEASSIAL